VGGLGGCWVGGWDGFFLLLDICIDVFLREPNPKKLTCFLFGAGFWLNRAAFFSSIFCFTISLFRPSCTTWDV